MSMKKIKDNKGVALALVIVVIAILSIFVILISNQLINKIKVTSNNYQNIKEKYIAEAGIERSISEIYNEIISNINKNGTKNTFLINEKIDHSKHNFMQFDQNGKPDTNSFYKFIIMDLLEYNDGTINDDLNYSYKTILTNFQWYVQQVITDEQNNDLNTNYVFRIFDLIETDIYNKGNLNWTDSNVKLLEYELNLFINKLSLIKRDVLKGNHSQSLKNNAIEYIDKMKNIMIEIKCRLNMDISSGETVENIVEINIPYYKVYEGSNQDLEFKKNISNINKSIKIITKGGKLVDIDFNELNSTVIRSEGSIKENGEIYRIEADIDFNLKKGTNDKYSIEHTVNYYKKVS